VIGESGSGKSTLGRVLTGLLPASAGQIRLAGVTLAPAAAQRTREQLRQIQIVFQMADTALNPAHSIRQILERPLVFYHQMDAGRRRRRVTDLLDMVRLPAELGHGSQRIYLAARNSGLTSRGLLQPSPHC
jgi:peptide/nickel transport system ATP-binding protein